MSNRFSASTISALPSLLLRCSLVLSFYDVLCWAVERSPFSACVCVCVCVRACVCVCVPVRAPIESVRLSAFPALSPEPRQALPEGVPAM